MADIFRHRGPAWRASHAGHVSLGQLKVMSAIERCRTVALGGHVERCVDCAHPGLRRGRLYASPTTPAATGIVRSAKPSLPRSGWPTARPNCCQFPTSHVVFTLPGPIADIAYHNKAVVYDLLLKVAAET